jgi:sortase A
MATGLTLVGSGMIQPAKALLGQVLLDAAFTNGGVQPWPDADMRPVARIQFERLGISRIVLDQASSEGMAWGPGIVDGTMIPGNSGLSVIAGHRDSHMAFLRDVRIGDTLTIETLDENVMEFKVWGAIVVDGSRWRVPAEEHGQASVYLTTCWPFGVQESGHERLVVMADPA